MSLPNLFLIGAPKAGTTSLAGWLADHPDVYFCVPKEPYYWASDYPRLRGHYGFDNQDRYAGLFASERARKARFRADGSTNYLYSETAVPDILARADQPRFIVALRNPVDLLVSYHRTELIALNEDETDFAAAWRRSVAGGSPATIPLDPKLVDYPLVGRLGQAVDRLLRRVPRESIHFVLFDDLAAEPLATWVGLTGFLGLPEEPVPTFDVRNASNKTYRWASLRRLTHRPPRLLAPPMRWLRHWSRTTSNPAAARLKARMWQAERRPEVGPEIRAEVADYLAEDTEHLARLIGVDLSHWVSVSSR